MKLNKQDKEDLMQVYNTWWNSYLTGDVKTYDSFLDEEFRFVGSTNNEEFLSRKDTTDFFDATADQLAGKAELRNTIRKIEVLGNGLVLITDLADAYVVGEPEWVFYSRFRFTCLLRKTENGWRFIYQHFSAPDTKAQEGETLGLKQISKENQELRDAIKRRTVELEHKNRELEIETALERVRARTMAMQKGEEVKDVVVLLYKELIKLGVTNFATCGYVEINEKTKRQETWVTNPGGDSLGLFYLPLTGDVLFDERYEAWEKQQVVFHQTVAGKKRREHLEYAITTFNSKEAEEMVLNQFPDPTVFYCFNFSHGYLHLVSGSKLKEEEESLLARFTRVFQQTYTRFLDLQKAEARAREAQIEAALERTRTQSMLMKHSDEMTQLSKIFHEQLIALDIPSEFSYIWLPDEAKKDHMFWATWTELKNKKASTVSKSVTYPLDKTEPYTAACFKAWKSDIPVHVTKIPAEEVAHFFTTWDDLISGAKKLKARYFPEGIYYAESYMKYGCFGINIRRPLNENEQSILQRFTIEFERAYTRFLDLKKAEAQAREAQIELALERVRARTMAMQQSNELGDVATVLFKELNLIVENLWTCGFVLCEKNRGDDEWWVSTKEGFIPAFYLPNTVDVTHENMHKAWESGETYHTEQLEGKALQEHYDWLMNIPASKKVFDEMSANGISLPTWQKLHGAFFSYGYLVMITRVPCPEEAIFKRFAQVFDQTYTRFLDLQKAEAQAREAQIELALERVRARAMSMQKSDELSDLVGTVFTELTKLDFALSWCIINIIDESNKSNVVWGANTEAEKPPESYFMKFEDHRFHHEMMKAYQERKEKWVFVLDGDEKRNYDDYLFTDTEFRKVSKKVQQEMRSTKRYIASFTFSSFGGLQTIGEEPLSEENLNILNRFGKVFDLTYTRFNDLLKAEAQAREAQIEAALEKVRSHSIGMQKSEELKEVIQIIHDQLIHLNFEIDAAGFTLDYHQNNDWNIWIANKSTSLPSLMFVPYIDHPQFNHYKSAKEKGLDFLANTLSFEEKNSIFNYMFEYMGDYPQAERDEVLRKPGLAISQAFLNNISLWIYNLDAIPYSKEDNNTLMRFAKVFQQTYTRFLDLKKAEEQAREAQIEAALEKVRSRSLAMHKPEELKEVVAVVAEKLQELDVIIDAGGVIICTYFPDNKDVIHWIAETDFSNSGKYLIPYFDDLTFNDAWDSKQNGEAFFTKTYTKEVKNNFFNYAFEHTGYKNFPDDFKQFVLNSEKIALSFAWAKNSAIMLPSHTGIVPSENHIEILKRFAKVFEQAYIRFLDLQRAEAQAREAQIELALERIRVQATTMTESSDLLDIVVTMRTEFVSLGHEAHHFWHMRYLPEIYEKAMTSGDGTRIGMVMSLPRHIHGDIKLLADWEKSDEPTVVFAMDTETAVEYIHKMITLGDFKQVDPNAPTLDDIRHIGGLTFIMARTTHGEIGFSLPGYVPNPPQEDLDTLVRFAGVFDLAYRRFEDLKAAEAQAHEAQIEAALERVRSRSMAMHKSEELADLSFELVKQIQALGVPTWFCAFNIYDDDQKGSLEWGSNSEGTYPSYRTPREGIFLRYYEAGQKGETFLVNEIGENECAAHYDYLCSLPGVGEQLLKIRDTGIPFPTSQIDHVAYFKYGYILFITFEPAPEAHEVFKRFANVFEQTYTRFLDLKKAEKQAREAQIETALERVRARAMAMQQPEELKEVAQVLRQEMGLLGVEELETSSIYINDENAHIAECWYAIKDVRKTKKKLVTDHFALDLNDTWVGGEMLKFHKSNKKQISIVMTGESRIEWIRYCEEKSIPFRGYYGDLIPDRTYHLYKFSHGAIGAATPGDFSDENWGLLRRVASVFSLAYSRFKDLTQARIDLLRLKEEKKRAEDALSNLKSTQTQLIHAEKMASLGELTAGIAHEIQNPLNFVNNFSDVSVDLIEEMDEEMTLGNTDEVKDIASDLKQNLEKIHHHGKRASFIVQGMLEHSRTNPGDKKPTDINVLADEFLRLSYHGLRAKDKSFNAEFITEFDDDLPEIAVIPQDFGRVLLNLINNAFYACAERSRSTVAEKQKIQKENYKPAVLVHTQKIGDNVEIRVKDNGNGIPDDVLKKIFQPFFTTKPTGEGTGLGLSMSYDIITKGHGGKLEVETKEGEGTIFLISIPIKS